MKITDRIKGAFNLLTKNSQWDNYNNFINSNNQDYSYSSSSRYALPSFTNAKADTIITSIFNRIAVDVASMEFKHVILNDNGQYKEIVNSGLNNCLTLSANIDQTPRALLLDIMISLIDEGCIAVVPTSWDTDTNDILSLRVAKIINWMPTKVEIEIYNDITGSMETYYMEKSKIAILENPFYSIMNQQNSTLSRLNEKLRIIDAVDNKNIHGGINLIIQSPHSNSLRVEKGYNLTKSQEIVQEAMSNSLGIVHLEGTDKVTQVHKQNSNSLMEQVKYLSNLLMTQIGFNESLLDNTASEEVYNTYNNKILEPYLNLICDEFTRKFLTVEDIINKKQKIIFNINPFKLVPAGKIADLADKLSRNEILSSNEVRSLIGFLPSSQDGADELRNKNISQPKSDENNEKEN